MPKVKRPRVIVTAGPTREMLDAVRFISNVSTGEMGYAIARQARKLGWKVTLISGPTALKPPAGVRFVPILNAQDLLNAILNFWPQTDVLIMSAAVCDFKPEIYSVRKIKRKQGLTLSLKATPDILEFFGRRKQDRMVVGFALETEDLEKNARRKLVRKHLDLMVANQLGKGNEPFGKGRHAFMLIGKNDFRRDFKRVSKDRMAKAILDVVETSQTS